jgi:hypothetical protein
MLCVSTRTPPWLQAKAAQQAAAAAAAAREAAQRRGTSVAAALLALGATAGLQLAQDQEQAQGSEPTALQAGSADAVKLETAMQRLSGAQPPSPAGSPLRRRVG